MKKTLIISLLFLYSIGFSQEFAVNKAGDTIVLNSDKTWKYRNENKSDEKITSNDFKETFESDGKTQTLSKNGCLFLRSKDGKMSLSRKIISEDGAGNKVKVDFSILISEAQLQELGVNKINQVNNDALLKTKYTLKNKYTFIPREINWHYSDKGIFKGKWLVAVKYSAQNDFGALKDGQENLLFNIDGTEYKH